MKDLISFFEGSVMSDGFFLFNFSFLIIAEMAASIS
jgi:hypothetical protein